MIEFLGWAWQAVTLLLGCTVEVFFVLSFATWLYHLQDSRKIVAAELEERRTGPVGDALVTMDDAIEAGILAAAYRKMPELISATAAEANGPIDPKHSRWKLMALELWGKDHEDDSSQEHVGPEVLLPPVFAVRAMRLVREAIAVRLGELGVVVEP